MSVISKRLQVAVLAASIAAAAVTTEALDYVVPTNGATGYGNATTVNPCLSTASRRYQQVYAASEFQAAQSPQAIRGIRFRIATATGTFYLSGSYMEVRLSTTTRSPDGLSTTFADNVGADETLVYAGTNFQFVGSSSLGRFSISTLFQQPFHYDHALGNLLVEIRMPGSYSFSGYSLDATNATGDAVSRLYANATNALTGAADSAGAITQFVFQDTVLTNLVPEITSDGLVFGFTSVSNARYRLQASTDVTGDFVDVSAVITGRPPINVVTQVPGTATRFFRVQRIQ